MSSRLIRTGDGKAAQAVAWTPGGGGVAHSRGADPQNDAAAKRDFDAKIQAAYQQGYAAGQAAGIQQASERIEPAAGALNRMVAELSSSGKRFRAEVEQDTVRLAIAIARRVLHRELATDPEAIHGLVIAAFQRLNARETHRLRLNPADASIVEQHRSRLGFPPALEVAADPALPPASAIFETSRGELDASVDTQLAEIDRGFTDLVRRRAR